MDDGRRGWIIIGFCMGSEIVAGHFQGLADNKAVGMFDVVSLGDLFPVCCRSELALGYAGECVICFDGVVCPDDPCQCA